MEPEQNQPQATSTNEVHEAKKGNVILLVFLLGALIVIALLWKNTQENSMDETILIPPQEIPTAQEEPQSEAEMEQELTTIEAELGELDSEVMIESL